MTNRVQILKTPVMPPGTCVVCGSSGDEKRSFIDFGFTIDYFGVVYFCTICFAEISIACNFVDNTHYQELLQRNQELIEALEQAQLRNNDLNNTIRRYFSSDSPDDTLRDVSDHYEVSRTSERDNQYTVVPAEDTDKSSDIEELGSILDATDIDIESIAGNPLKF